MKDLNANDTPPPPVDEITDDDRSGIKPGRGLDLFFIDGWSVIQYGDADTLKKTFVAVHVSSGRRRVLDVSPYRAPTKGMVSKMIDMRFPKRVGIGPLDEREIDRLHHLMLAWAR